MSDKVVITDTPKERIQPEVVAETLGAGPADESFRQKLRAIHWGEEKKKVFTVHDLVRVLMKMDPSHKVLRGDNSGGYEEVRSARITTVTDIFTKQESIAVVLE